MTTAGAGEPSSRKRRCSLDGDFRGVARVVCRAPHHDHPGGPLRGGPRPPPGPRRVETATRCGRTGLHPRGRACRRHGRCRSSPEWRRHRDDRKRLPGHRRALRGHAARGSTRSSNVRSTSTSCCPTSVKQPRTPSLRSGPTGWLAYLRTLWLRTDAILGQHWLAVKMLALELQQTGTVRRDRAQELLDRWMPVRGESLFEVLANLNPKAVPGSSIDAQDLPDIRHTVM